MEIRTDYLPCVFDPVEFRGAVNKAIGQLTEFRKDTPFDAIAFTGVSGAAMAFPLSFALGIPLLCVRKGGENSHSPYKVEGDYAARRYVIVDDFISTGNTMRRIQEDLENEIAGTPVLVGIYLYRNMCYSDWTDIHDEQIPVLPDTDY